MKIWISFNILLAACYFIIAVTLMFSKIEIADNAMILIGVVFMYHSMRMIGRAYFFRTKVK